MSFKRHFLALPRTSYKSNSCLVYVTLMSMPRHFYGIQIFIFDAQYAKFGGKFLSIICYSKKHQSWKIKTLLSSKFYQKFFTRHQTKFCLVTGMNFGSNSYWQLLWFPKGKGQGVRGKGKSVLPFPFHLSPFPFSRLRKKFHSRGEQC